MSQTVPAGIMSGSYWAYVASAMVDGLGQILGQQGSPASIPRRVYVDAKEFFRLAIEGAGNTVPTNPSASIANYIIAADAAKIEVTSEAQRAQLEARLQEFASLLRKLEDGVGPADAKETASAVALKDFFAGILHEAELEAYERAVAFKMPPTALKLR